METIVASKAGHVHQESRICEGRKFRRTTYNRDSYVYEADMNS